MRQQAAVPSRSYRCIGGVSVHIIYRLIHERQLFAYKDEGGKAWHIPEDAIRDYVVSRRASVRSPE